MCIFSRQQIHILSVVIRSRDSISVFSTLKKVNVFENIKIVLIMSNNFIQRHCNSDMLVLKQLLLKPSTVNDSGCKSRYRS